MGCYACNLAIIGLGGYYVYSTKFAVRSSEVGLGLVLGLGLRWTPGYLLKWSWIGFLKTDGWSGYHRPKGLLRAVYVFYKICGEIIRSRVRVRVRVKVNARVTFWNEVELGFKKLTFDLVLLIRQTWLGDWFQIGLWEHHPAIPSSILSQDRWRNGFNWDLSADKLTSASFAEHRMIWWLVAR